MSAVPSWSELTFLMVHGPDVPMRGRIRHHDGEQERYFSFVQAEGDPEPAFPRGSGDVVAAWRWGRLLRVEDPDGQVRLVSDGTTAWTFLESDALPTESPLEHVEFVLGGTELLVRTDAERWVGDDFTRPTGPPVATTYLGRSAWEVELAPPDRKPAPLQIVVDAETGMLLQQRNDAFGLVREWTELTVGEDLDPSLFTWTGPAITWEQQREDHRREREAVEAEHARWLDEHLGTRSLRVTLDVRIEVHEVTEDGSLYAYVDGVGQLLRRPRSDALWERVDGDWFEHRWSDADWDWALGSPDNPLAPDALADLQAQLGAHSRRSSP